MPNVPYDDDGSDDDDEYNGGVGGGGFGLFGPTLWLLNAPSGAPVSNGRVRSSSSSNTS